MENRILLFGFLGLLLISACREDALIGEVVDPIDPIDVPSFTELDLRGRVVDVDGQGIAGAKVTIGTSEFNTDEYGFYTADEVLAPTTGLYLKAEKVGYFVGGEQYQPNGVDNEAVVIMTLPEYEEAMTFPAADGVNMVLSDGSTLVIPENAVSLNGVAYDGDVIANMLWLDPTANETTTLMPGALLGVRESGETQFLQTFGMIGVELQDPAGNQLQITEGFQAELSFPIPADVQGAAPDEIPLWFFDEDLGVWIEEGVATRSGNMYVGKVNHFTWWNCDIPGPYTNLCLNFFDPNGDPLEFGEFCLTSSLGVASGELIRTNVFCALVPSDQVISLEVKGNCGESYYMTDIGPYAEGDANEIVNINTMPANGFVTVTGTVENCNEPVTNGFVTIETAFGTFADLYVDDGTYSISFVVCDLNETEVTFVATDLNEFEQSPELIENLDYGVSTNVFNLEACGDPLPEGLYLVLEPGTTNDPIVTNPNCEAKVTPEEIIITTSDDDLGPEGAYNLVLGALGTSEGTFDGNFFLFLELSNGLVQKTPVDGFQVEIINLGNVGEYVTGRFNDQGTINGTFKALRTQ